MAHIKDLKPDTRNARKHNPRNVGMIETSIQQNGFGRSILLANDGTIIAGNATVDASASAGIEDMIIVKSDGSKVIAVQRTDVEPGSQRFHNLALADNRAADLADWDADMLALLAADDIDLSQFWVKDELDQLLASLNEPDWDSAFGSLPDGDKAPFEQMTFTLHTSQADIVRAAMEAARNAGPFIGSPNEDSNGNALARICEAYANA